MLRMFIIVLHVLGNDWKFILYINCETIGNSFYIRKLNENVHYVLGNH